MNARNVFGVLLAVGLVFAWSASSLAAEDINGDGVVDGGDIQALVASGQLDGGPAGSSLPATRGDRIVDLYVNLQPAPDPADDPLPSVGLWIQSDGRDVVNPPDTVADFVSAYDIRSAQGIFTRGPQNHFGLFFQYSADRIGEGFLPEGAFADGYFLGDILDPSTADWTADQFLEDLTGTFLVYNNADAGTALPIDVFVIPEPSTLVMLFSVAAVGLVAFWRRRRS